MPVPERGQVVPPGGVVMVAFPDGPDIEVEEYGGVGAVVVSIREVRVAVPVVARVAVGETHEHTASTDAWI